MTRDSRDPEEGWDVGESGSRQVPDEGGHGADREDVRNVLESMIPPESMPLQEESIRSWTWPGGQSVPGVVVAPGSEQEVSEILRVCSDRRWSVLPAGGARCIMAGGGSGVDVVLSTRRLDTMYEYEPADLTFTAGAGMTLRALRQETAARGQWLPLDPPEGMDGTLGATVAMGLRGSLGYLYGGPRDHVLGLTLVSGDGRILRWGGRVVKNVAGFDVTRLCVGSWGLLGVVTRVSARLFPVPDSDRTLLVYGHGMTDLVETARTVFRSGLPVAGVDLLDPLPSGVDGKEGGSRPRARAGLVVRMLGSSRQVDGLTSRLIRLLPDAEGYRTVLDGEPSRHLHSDLQAWGQDCALVIRLSYLPSALPSLVREALALKTDATGRLRDPEARLLAQMGSGTLRIAFAKSTDLEESVDWWVSALRRLRSRVQDRGGSMTLARAPLDLMRRVGYWGEGAQEQRIMRGLKDQFDPRGIMAPGRMGL